jgi:hypothetical protein
VREGIGGGKSEREPPCARVWGEGGDGRRLERALVVGNSKGNPHALAFGARVGMGGDLVREGVDGGKPEEKPPRTRAWGEGEGGQRERESAARNIKGKPHALMFGVVGSHTSPRLVH